jgi:hypothetical protein
MKTFKSIFLTPMGLIPALPLVFGLAGIMAVPTAEAAPPSKVNFNEVDIVQGHVDVNEDTIIDGADVLNDVVLWCGLAAPVRMDILPPDGLFDVNEDGVIDGDDDITDCAMTDEDSGIPSNNRVDIGNGGVNVDEDGALFEVDDDSRNNIQLFHLVP